jgi:cell division protein FtsL
MKLFRISSILSLSAAVFMAVLLFWTSQDVQKKEHVLSGLKRELAHEKEAVSVLNVEWDYLNRPQRLEKMAREQLDMELPTSGGVVVSIDDIPEPVQVVENPDMYEEGSGFMPVSQADEAVQRPVAPAASSASETISPSTAEKQSFDRLIEQLDTQPENGQ